MSLFDQDDQRKSRAWNACQEHPSANRDVWRIDAHGRVIRWSDYGDRKSQFGWELDHFPIPAALGGGDHPGNLRALHWESNASHGGLLGNMLANKPNPVPQGGLLANLLASKPTPAAPHASLVANLLSSNKLFGR